MPFDITRDGNSIGGAVLPDVAVERGIKASRTGVSPQAGRMSMVLDREELAIDNQAQLLEDAEGALWTGTVRDVQQSVDRSLNALRWSARASGAIADIVAVKAGAFTPVYESITVDVAMNHVLDAIGWPAARRRIAVSQRVLAWWWLEASVTPWRALLQLMLTDGPTARLFENGIGQLEFTPSRVSRPDVARTLYGQLDGTGERPIITLLDREDAGLDRVINSVHIPYARRPNVGESSVGGIDWGSYNLSDPLNTIALANARNAAIGDRVLAIAGHCSFTSGAAPNPTTVPHVGLQGLYGAEHSQSLGSTTEHQQDVSVTTEDSSVGERSGGVTLVSHHEDVRIATGASSVAYGGNTWNARGTAGRLLWQSIGSGPIGARIPRTMRSSATVTQGGAGTGTVTIPSGAVNVQVTVQAVTRYSIHAYGRSRAALAGTQNEYRIFYVDFQREISTRLTRAPKISRNGNTVTATPPNSGRTFSTDQLRDVDAYEYDVTVRVSWQVSTTLPLTGWRERFAIATDPSPLTVGAAATQWRRIQGGAGSETVTIPEGATNIRISITALSRRWVRYSSATASNRASTTKGTTDVLSTASDHVEVTRSGNTITVTPVARSGTTTYQAPASVVSAGSVSSYVATVRVQWVTSTQPRTFSELSVTHGIAPIPDLLARTQFTGESTLTRRTTTNLALLYVRDVADPRIVEVGDNVGAGTILAAVTIVESRLDQTPVVQVASGWTLTAGAPVVDGGTGSGRVLFIATRRMDAAGAVPTPNWTLTSGETQPSNPHFHAVIVAFAVDRDEVWKSGEEIAINADQAMDVEVMTDGPIYDIITPVEGFDYSVLSGAIDEVEVIAAPHPGAVIRMTAGDQGAHIKGLRLRGITVIGGLSKPDSDDVSIAEFGLQHPASVGTWPWIDETTATALASAWISDRARPLRAWDLILDADRNSETRRAALRSEIGEAIRTALDDDFDLLGEVLALKLNIANPAGNVRTTITVLELR